MQTIWFIDIYNERCSVVVNSNDIVVARRIWDTLVTANMQMLSARP